MGTRGERDHSPDMGSSSGREGLHRQAVGLFCISGEKLERNRQL